MTFEGTKTQGAQAILQKLTSLPFQACKHHISSLDAQPSPSGGMNIFVTGQLQVQHMTMRRLLRAASDLTCGPCSRGCRLFNQPLHLIKT